MEDRLIKIAQLKADIDKVKREMFGWYDVRSFATTVLLVTLEDGKDITLESEHINIETVKRSALGNLEMKYERLILILKKLEDEGTDKSKV